MAKIDIELIKAFCETGIEHGIDDILDTVYPETIRNNMRHWEQGYEAAMNSVLHFISLYDKADN